MPHSTAAHAGARLEQAVNGVFHMGYSPFERTLHKFSREVSECVCVCVEQVRSSSASKKEKIHCKNAGEMLGIYLTPLLSPQKRLIPKPFHPMSLSHF